MAQAHAVMRNDLTPGLLPHYRTQILGWKCNVCGQTFLLPEPREYSTVSRIPANVEAAFRTHQCCSPAEPNGENHQ